MSTRTAQVTNLSLGASEQDIYEFFSFSGDIEHIELRGDTQCSQIAYVTFKEPQGAETAVLLSGATIVDMTVTITLASEYTPPPPASLPASKPTVLMEMKNPSAAESAFQRAEEVVSSMLAKGFVLGKDVVNKAKTFDEKHQVSYTASAKVAAIDQKIGLSEKITMGKSIVNEKVIEVDQKLQVSEKAKSAFAAAEQTVANAGSAIMKNRYVSGGASWVTGAFNKVAKAAGDVTHRTKEKVGMAEDEQRRKMVNDYAQIHLSESPTASESNDPHPHKSAPAHGLIL